MLHKNACPEVFVYLLEVVTNQIWGSELFDFQWNGGNMVGCMLHGVWEINQFPRSSPTSSGTWKGIFPWVLIKKTMKHFILAASGKGWCLLVETEESVKILFPDTVWGDSCGQGDLSSSVPKYLKPYLCNELSKIDSLSSSHRSLQLLGFIFVYRVFLEIDCNLWKGKDSWLLTHSSIST